jgi:hypothetical protein
MVGSKFLVHTHLMVHNVIRSDTFFLSLPTDLLVRDDCCCREAWLSTVSGSAYICRPALRTTEVIGSIKYCSGVWVTPSM